MGTETNVGPVKQTAEDSFQLALSHLQRVQASWDDPTDWADLSSYGLYCLEAAVVAAALHLDKTRPNTHPAKAAMAELLREDHDLPAIEDLLVDLNGMRKYKAYGDTDPPETLDPEEAATAIEQYVDAVRKLLAQ